MIKIRDDVTAHAKLQTRPGALFSLSHVNLLQQANLHGFDATSVLQPLMPYRFSTLSDGMPQSKAETS